MGTKLFRVVWEMDIEATGRKEAAIEALKIQRDPNSIATVFNVTERRGTPKFEEIDLCTLKHSREK